MDKKELTTRLTGFIAGVSYGTYVLVDVHPSGTVRIGAPGINKYWTVRLDDVLLTPDDMFDQLDEKYRKIAAVLGVEA